MIGATMEARRSLECELRDRCIAKSCHKGLFLFKSLLVISGCSRNLRAKANKYIFVVVCFLATLVMILVCNNMPEDINLCNLLEGLSTLHVGLS